MRVLLLAILVVLVSGCVGQTTTQTEAPTNEEPTIQETYTTAEVKEFTVKMLNYKFEPSTISVNQGDYVKITVINEEGYHNFFIGDYNQRTTLEYAPDTQILEFTADKSGTFGFWCEVTGHRALGMEGQLIVE